MAGATLEPDVVLRSRWKVKKKLAEGGFGAVYKAWDTKDERQVAIKIETCQQANPVLKMDTAVMLKLRGKSQHVCGILGAGTEDGRFNFVVMSLVGASLDELQKSTEDRRFKETTTFRLARQCLKAIENVHSVGFIHRDVKPGNFAIGRRPSDRRIVYMLDFGLARYFRGAKAAIRNKRASCGFRGTVRYASTNAHNGGELARHDDIYSLLYMIIEFHRGRLPWQDVDSDEAVGNMKQKTSMADLIGDMGDEMMMMFKRLNEMKYKDKPDYKFFQDQFAAIQKRKKLSIKGPFEWEDESKKKNDE